MARGRSRGSSPSGLASPEASRRGTRSAGARSGISARSICRAKAWRGQTGYLPDGADSQRWTRILHETRGWSVPRWPVEHGGTGWTPAQRYIFEEECYLAGAPIQNQAGVDLVGPVIYKYGNEEQKERFLPPIREGERVLDPGLLRARFRIGPRLAADHGRSRWRSLHRERPEDLDLHRRVRRLELRAGPDRSRRAKQQNGISFLLLDVEHPRRDHPPDRRASKAAHHLAEVFYDNVRVPAENLVGEENKGWDYTKLLLFNERAFYGAEAPVAETLSAQDQALRARGARRRAAADRRPRPSPRGSRELELEVLAIDMTVARVHHQHGRATATAAPRSARSSRCAAPSCTSS